eukprot:8209526-Pyramimonas_sp.AAC.1
MFARTQCVVILAGGARRRAWGLNFQSPNSRISLQFQLALGWTRRSGGARVHGLSEFLRQGII